MSCSSPVYALKIFSDVDNKMHIKFFSHDRVDYDYNSLCLRYGKENILVLPCGRCPSCLEARARSWAGRCVLEASSFHENSFLTLTYRDACLPKGGLCKKDMQNFLKRLRKRYPEKKIRYFLAGEYGPSTHRPHYHLLVFGWFPEDAQLLLDQGEHSMFTSKILNELWPFGFATLSFIDYASCAYVARYTHKKVGLEFIDKEGLNREFIMMSTHPGLGVSYFSTDIYETDKLYFPFSDKVHCMAPSRYFDKLLERLDPSILKEVKDRRLSNADLSLASSLLKHGLTYREELDAYHGKIKKDKINRLVRKDL